MKESKIYFGLIKITTRCRFHNPLFPRKAVCMFPPESEDITQQCRECPTWATAGWVCRMLSSEAVQACC